MDLIITVCDFNTPYLIENLVKSINLVCEEIPRILVINTGDHMDSYAGASAIWQPKASHGEAVNMAMNFVKNRYMLLVDSDVLFLKDFKKPFEKFVESGVVLMGEVVGDRGGKSLYPRVNPWYCFLDLKQLKDNNIQFYDHHRTKVLKSEKTYDIGSTMFEDVMGKGLEVGNAKMENVYFKHYEGMSWRVQKYNPYNTDTDIDVGGTHPNKALYEYGLQVQRQYLEDVEYLKDVKVKPSYTI